MCGGLGKGVIWDMRSILIFLIALVRLTLKLSSLVILAILYSLHLRYEHYCHTTLFSVLSSGKGFTWDGETAKKRSTITKIVSFHVHSVI